MNEIELLIEEQTRRHKRAIFIHYSTMLARWESQWHQEDRLRAARPLAVRSVAVPLVRPSYTRGFPQH